MSYTICDHSLLGVTPIYLVEIEMPPKDHIIIIIITELRQTRFIDFVE